jgi:hypothetical protein
VCVCSVVLSWAMGEAVRLGREAKGSLGGGKWQALPSPLGSTSSAHGIRYSQVIEEWRPLICPPVHPFGEGQRLSL